MAKSDDFSGASAATFLDAYAALHAEVYGFAPSISDDERAAAIDAAGALLRECFDGDPDRMADFVRWTWQREKSRSKRDRARSPLAPRFAFSRELVTDFRVDERRAGEAPKPALELIRDSEGRVTASIANVVTILGEHPEWRGVVVHDLLAEEVRTTKPAPWHAWDAPADHAAGPWEEEDCARVSAWIARTYGVEVPTAKVREALAVVARRNAVHPVRDWLKSLRWDGVARLDHWLVSIGAEDTPVTREAGRVLLMSAVARALEPGCKADVVVVLEGPQGSFKSTLCKEVAGETRVYLETGAELGTKDAMQDLRGKWIVELSELDSLERSELSRVKAFISARTDTFRASYGRTSKDRPRQCVFIGTTNSDAYLKDETGNRRFLPVRIVRPIDIEAFREMRAQLFAEAVARVERGEPWHTTDAALLREAEKEQASRVIGDPWDREIERWLMDPKAPERRRDGVTTAAVLAGALGLELAKLTRREEMRAAGAMRRLGWTPGAQERRDGSRVRLYRPRQVTEVVTEVVTRGGPDKTGTKARSAQPSQLSQPTLKVIGGRDPHAGITAVSGVTRIGRDGCDTGRGEPRNPSEARTNRGVGGVTT